jgi:hypothetical protein
MGLYVYAVVHADGRSAAPIHGLLEQPVYQVAAGGLAAIVSDYPAVSVRPERKHIAADQAVMRKLYSERDMLPMAFGTLTQSKEALVDFIEQQSEALNNQLQRVAGCIEMGLRLSLDVDDLAAFTVERTPTLKAARDKTYARRRPPSHDDMIRLGQAFDTALKERPRRHSSRARSLRSARKFRRFQCGPRRSSPIWRCSCPATGSPRSRRRWRRSRQALATRWSSA